MNARCPNADVGVGAQGRLAFLGQRGPVFTLAVGMNDQHHIRRAGVQTGFEFIAPKQGVGPLQLVAVCAENQVRVGIGINKTDLTFERAQALGDRDGFLMLTRPRDDEDVQGVPRVDG